VGNFNDDDTPASRPITKNVFDVVGTDEGLLGSFSEHGYDPLDLELHVDVKNAMSFCHPNTTCGERGPTKEAILATPATLSRSHQEYQQVTASTTADNDADESESDECDSALTALSHPPHWRPPPVVSVQSLAEALIKTSSTSGTNVPTSPRSICSNVADEFKLRENNEQQ
jgi:hypothetical protein